MAKGDPDCSHTFVLECDRTGTVQPLPFIFLNSSKINYNFIATRSKLTFQQVPSNLLEQYVIIGHEIEEKNPLMQDYSQIPIIQCS